MRRILLRGRLLTVLPVSDGDVARTFGDGFWHDALYPAAMDSVRCWRK